MSLQDCGSCVRMWLPLFLPLPALIFVDAAIAAIISAPSPKPPSPLPSVPPEITPIPSSTLPSLSISRLGREVSLDYSLRGTRGVFSLLFYGSLNDFPNRAISLFDGDMASSRTGRLTFSNFGQNLSFSAGFFRLMENPNALIADYALAGEGDLHQNYCYPGRRGEKG